MSNVAALGKRSKSIILQEDENIRRAREVMLNGPKKLTRTKTLPDDNVFKVPELPFRTASFDSLASQTSSQDVFGSIKSVSTGKGKDIEKPGWSELEKANKTVCVLPHL